MKTLTNFNGVNKLLSIILLTVILFGCSKDDEADKPIYPSSPESGLTKLTPVEQQGLLYMVEFEKMLADMYNLMSARTGSAVLKEIADTKTRHMFIIADQIDKYGVENPLSGRQIGEYKHPGFQKLYDDLKVSTPNSESTAIELGRQLENTLIRDLQFYLESLHDHSDLINMYNKIIEETKNGNVLLGPGFTGLEDIALPFDLVLEE